MKAPQAETAPLTLFGGLDPDSRGREFWTLLKYRGEDGWGEQAPKKKPGDIYVIIGAAVGMLAGGIFGYYINPFMAAVGIVAGGTVGAVTGWLLLSLIRKHKKSRTRQQGRA